MEDRKSKDDKISGGMWKVVETETRKSRIAEVEERRKEGRGRKKMRRKGKTKI